MNISIPIVMNNHMNIKTDSQSATSSTASKRIRKSTLAGAIITGDADLLVLSPFRGIPIITPEEFLRDVG